MPELLPDRLFLSEPVPLLLFGYCPERSVESCHMPLPWRPMVSWYVPEPCCPEFPRHVES